MLARIPDDELTKLLEGYGHTVYRVEGDDPATMHRQMATTLDTICDHIADIQTAARNGTGSERPRWPVLVLRSPKG